MIPARRLITKTNPFITERFTAYEGDTIQSHVSLVVWLVDEFTGKPPLGDVAVRLKEVEKKPIRNLSGYYCFTDLADGDYTILVKPDSVRSDSYFPQEVNVTVPMPNKLEPVAEIKLKPKISYPFQLYTTLIRGFVVRTVSGETVPLPNIPVYRLMAENQKGVETITNQNGEFILYIKKFEKGAGPGMEVSIEADNAGIKEPRKFSILREGTTVTINIEFTA